MTQELSASDLAAKRIDGTDLFNKIILGGMALSALALLAYCIWVLDRGFEITDESYYLLLALYPDAVKLFNSAQHWITSGLWVATGSLFGFRAAGLGALILSALVLGFGCIRVSVVCNMPVARFPGRLVVIASTIAGALVYGSTINFSPCYNLLASAGGYAAVGFTLLSFNRESGWQTGLLRLLAGGSLGVLFLCKFPAGIVVLILTLILSVSLERTVQSRVLAGAHIFSGLILTLTFLFFSLSNPEQALKEFQMGMHFFRLVQTESMGSRLLRYLAEFFTHFIDASTRFSIPLVCFVFYFFTRRMLSAFVGVAFLVVIIISQGYMLGGWLRPASQANSMLAILGLSLLTTVPVWTKNRMSVILSGTLFILPYCVAFGTGNQLHTQIIVSIASWGTLIAILAFNDNTTWQNRLPAVILSAIFLSVVMAQVLTSGFPPYHMNSSIFAQTEAVKVGGIGIIKTDKETREFVIAIDDAVKRCGILPGRPFLGLYNIPGVALVVQGVPIFTPWINNVEQAEALRGVLPTEILNSAVVGLRLLPDGRPPQVKQILPDFPRDYMLCGTAVYPYEHQEVEIWVRNTRK